MIRILGCDKETVREFELGSLEDARQLPVIWVDVAKPTEDELRLLQEKFQLHPLAIEDALHRGQRPKAEDYEEHLFTVLHTLRSQNGKVVWDEIFIFTGERWLITIHEKDPQITDIFDKVLRPGKARPLTQATDALYQSIVDRVVDGYFTVLDSVEDQIDDLESEVAQNPTKEALRRMDEIRKNLITVRRSVWPTREMVGSIMKGIFPIVSDQNIAYFRNIYDHVAQLMDLIEAYHARMSGIGELYVESLTASTSEAVRVFTILATIFLPPTLIASIYGMNFEGIPEFRWGPDGSYGYIFALILMGVVTIAPLAYLRARKLL